MENLPLGAQYDSLAPYNQKETIFPCGGAHFYEEESCRICEVTGQCLTNLGSGFVVFDGEYYFANKKDLIQFLKTFEEYKYLLYYQIIDKAYKNRDFYYTEFY